MFLSWPEAFDPDGFELDVVGLVPVKGPPVGVFPLPVGVVAAVGTPGVSPPHATKERQAAAITATRAGFDAPFTEFFSTLQLCSTRLAAHAMRLFDLDLFCPSVC